MEFNKQELTEMMCEAMLMAHERIEEWKREEKRREKAAVLESERAEYIRKGRNSILVALKNSNDHLSHGLLRNKVRKLSDYQAGRLIEDMVECGEIVMFEKIHARNGTRNRHYHLPG